MNPFLLPLSAGFRFGVRMRHTAYNHGWFKTRRLSRPVVSVGNLTVGGTGKTPLVAYVAGVLLRRGRKPAILTRGYGRGSRSALIAVPPGENRTAGAQEIGDEPALLARLLPEVPLIVCADRFRGGQVAEDRFQVDVHLLDDGFQHLRLARDVDLVTVDATEPLSDRLLLPAGRQREPLSALQRAQIVVLTRMDSTDTQSLQELVSKIHPRAKVFRCRTKLAGWRDALSGTTISAEEYREQGVAAFCGIGNPRAFFGDLRRWGFRLAAEDAFPDHHVYTREEIQGLVDRARRVGASALVTTQKDAVRLSPDWAAQLPILACEIAADILNADEFEKVLMSYLEKAP